MQIKPIRIGKITAPNNVFLAPMAGYTDYAFRTLALSLGAGFCFTELVSAKGTVYKAGGTAELLYCGNCVADCNGDRACANGEKGFDGEVAADNKEDNKKDGESVDEAENAAGNGVPDIKRTAAQLFGRDPYYMRAAAESDELKAFDVVDINMGCPVPKIYKNGEGSALLGDIRRAEAVVKAAVASGKTVTVKIRTGLKRGDDVATEFCRMAEASGASLVTIHGRVREDYYSGEPDYAAIARAKAAVNIPIIANGGIFTENDADLMMNKTGADGVMIARGAIEDPLIFARLTGIPASMTKKEFILKQLKLAAERKGDKKAAVEFRKFAPYYLKGMINAKNARIALSRAESVAEIEKIINSVFI